MISLENMSKSYGKKSILHSVSCNFKNDRISFLMGRNGSGKTTLIKCLFDLEAYDGKILFDGKKINGSIRRRCLVVWDDSPFYSGLTGIENLKIFSNSNYKSEEIINISSELLNVETLKTKVKHYSYGQKKKLALVLVKLSDPDYLVMDEITNGLDYETTKLLKQILLKWKKNKTIIMTGHNLSFYNDIIDDLFLLKDNSLTESDVHKHNTEVSLEDIYDSQIY
jgi:ABC-type multidrug transport system ATPase subunit